MTSLVKKEGTYLAELREKITLRKAEILEEAEIARKKRTEEEEEIAELFIASLERFEIERKERKEHERKKRTELKGNEFNEILKKKPETDSPKYLKLTQKNIRALMMELGYPKLASTVRGGRKKRKRNNKTKRKTKRRKAKRKTKKRRRKHRRKRRK